MAGSFFRVGFGVRLNVFAFAVYLWNPKTKCHVGSYLTTNFKMNGFYMRGVSFFRMCSFEVFVFVGVLLLIWSCFSCVD